MCVVVRQDRVVDSPGCHLQYWLLAAAVPVLPAVDALVEMWASCYHRARASPGIGILVELLHVLEVGLVFRLVLW